MKYYTGMIKNYVCQGDPYVLEDPIDIKLLQGLEKESAYIVQDRNGAPSYISVVSENAASAKSAIDKVLAELKPRVGRG